MPGWLAHASGAAFSPAAFQRKGMREPRKPLAIQRTAEPGSGTSRILICQEREASKKNKTRSLMFLQGNGEDRARLGRAKGSDRAHRSVRLARDGQMGIRSDGDH